MKEKFEFQDGCMMVQMPKEIDHHCAKELRQDLDRIIEMYRVRTLIFDFSQTEFMDSSGIGVLIGRCRNLGYSGGNVQAIHVSDRVQKIFMVSGLHKLIPIVTEHKMAGGRVDG